MGEIEQERREGEREGKNEKDGGKAEVQKIGAREE